MKNEGQWDQKREDEIEELNALYDKADLKAIMQACPCVDSLLRAITLYNKAALDRRWREFQSLAKQLHETRQESKDDF